MFNKRHLMFVLILVIFLCSTSIVSATDTGNLNDTSIESMSSIGSEQTSNEISEENTIKHDEISNKNVKEKLLRSPNSQVEISMEDKTIYYGEALEINPVITCEGDYDGIMTTYINEDLPDIRNLTFDSSEFILDTEDYYPGVYTITLDLGGSGNYDNAQTRAKLTVLQRPVEINGITLSYDDNNDVTLNFNVIDTRTSTPISDGRISIQYKNMEINSVDVDNDNLSLTIAKTYINQTIVFLYNDEYEIYSNYSLTQDITMNKFDLDFNVTDLSSQNNAPINHQIRLKSNRRINDGELRVYVDDILDSIYPVSSDIVDISIDTSKYCLGIHDIEYYYTESKIYNEVHKTSSMTLRNSTRIVLLNITPIEKGENIIISGILYNGNSMVADKDLTVNIGGIIYNTKTGANGLFTVNYNAVHAGNITITVNSPEDDKYLASSTTDVLEVNKIATSLQFNQIPDTIIGDTVNITVTLRNKTSVMGGENISLTINNQTNTYITDSNGQVTLPYITDSIGLVTVSGKYNESDDYLESTASTEFNVIKEETEIITVNNTIIVGSTARISAVLRTIDGQAVEAKTITFKIGQREYSNITDSNGLATVNISFDTVGKYNLSAIFLEDNQYMMSQSSSNIDVIRRNSTVTSYVSNFTAGNVTIHVSVSDDNYENNPVDFGTVIIKNGEEIIGESEISNGVADIQTNINNSGSYNLTVQYMENEYYNHDSCELENVTVTSRLTQTELTVNNNTYRNTSVTVIVKDSSTGNIINEGILELSDSNGLIKTVTINQSGISVVNINLSPGINNITVRYTGNSTYSESYDFKTLDIQKRESTINVNMLNLTSQNVTANVEVLDKVTGEHINNGTVIVRNGNKTIGNGEIIDGFVNITTDINEKGKYDLEFVYEGNDYYNSSKRELEDINILSRKTMTNATINNNTFGNTSISITVKDSETNETIKNGQLRIILSNQTEITKNINNTGITNVKLNLSLGNEVIIVEYPGNNTYEASSNTIETEIIRRDSLLDSQVSNTTAGNVTIKVSATDKITGTPIANGTIVIKNRDKTVGTGIISNGNATIITNISKIGDYDLELIYEGNEIYNPSNDTLSTSVTLRESIMEVEVQNTKILNTTIEVKLKDKTSNNPIANASVKILDENGNEIGSATTDNNGSANIKLDLTSGNHNITIIMPSTQTHNTINDTAEITVQKLESFIDISYINNSTITGSTSITGILYDINNNIIPEADIQIIINNVEHSSKTDTNGIFTYNVVNLDKTGINNVSIIFNPTEIHLGSTSTSTFNVYKIPTITSISKYDSSIAENASITVNVINANNGQLIKNGTINVYEENILIGTSQVDSSGKTIVKLDINTTGKHDITAQFTQTNVYDMSNSTSTINILKHNTSITLNPITSVKIAKITRITTQVLDNSTNQLLANARVRLNINGKSKELETDSKGILEYEYPTEKVGQNNITVEYLGDENNNPSNATGSFNVSKRNVTITVDPIASVIKDNITITAHVRDEFGEKVNAGLAVLKLNGLTLRESGLFEKTGETMKLKVKNGIVQYTMTAEKYLLNAKYLSASYGGSNNYLPDKTDENANARITLRNAIVKTKVNQSTAKHEEYITLIAEVKDKNTGLEPLYHKKSYVIFKVNGITLKDSNGQTIKLSVDKNGIATYNYFIKNGLSSMRNYTVDAVFFNTYYNPTRSHENATFNVNKSMININFNTVKISDDKLQINANIKTEKNSQVIGENKICVKINGKTVTDNQGNILYFNVKGGKINLTINNTVNNIKTVSLVTGERIAYLGTRATTEKIITALTSNLKKNII